MSVHDTADTSLKGWPRLRDLVASLVRHGMPLIGAEVGVSWGWTSESLLREFPTLLLLMIDYWDAMRLNPGYVKSGDSMAKLTADEQRVKKDKAIVRTDFARTRRRIIVADSVEAAGRIPDGWLDFAFIDGDHTLPGVERDFAAYALKVRAGGLIILHDIDHPRDKRGLWGVRRVAEQFARESGLTLEADSKQTIGWIRK